MGIDRFEKTADSFDIINKLNKLAISNKYVFRGYSQQSELYPQIIRNEDYSDVESEFLRQFEHYGKYYFQANTTIEFLSCAQHYGLPTRLLDFTYNPFIALFFALYAPKDGKCECDRDNEYYYIAYASIEDNVILNEMPCSENDKFVYSDSFAEKTISSLQDIDYLECIVVRDLMNSAENQVQDGGKDFEAVRDGKILFIDPCQSNQRIIMQQGLFMLPYTLNKQDHIEIVRENISNLQIHKCFRDFLLKYLSRLGYNSFRLMPDLSSICQAVKKNITNAREKGKSEHISSENI